MSVSILITTANRETMADANKTFSAGKTEVVTTVTLTAPRVLNIPLANTIPAGGVISFADEPGVITSTNTITVTRAGSDLINGATTCVLNIPYSVLLLKSDGVSKYTIVNPYQISPTYFIIKDAATGHKWRFTVDPTGMLSMPGEDLGL